MVSAPQRAKVVDQVEGAVAAGARLLTGGDAAGHDRGHFYGPAVITGAPAETDLLREETFGPVAPIVRVRCIEEAIALANGTRFGLGGFKQSGVGRELGQEGLEAFQETKHVHMETRIERKEWWYPYG